MAESSYIHRTNSAMYAQQVPQVARSHRESLGQAAAAYPQPTLQNGQGDNAMAAMMSAFSQTHLGAPTVNGSTNANVGQYPINTSQYFFTQDGQIVCIPTAGIYPSPPMATSQLSDGSFTGYPSNVSYNSQAAYPGYAPGFPMIPYTPARHGYYPDRSDMVHKDVPGLENRRGSYSTNESTPGTPYYGSVSQRGHGTHIAAVDRSPAYTTPSPEQLPHTHALQQIVKPLPYKSNYITVDIDTLLMQHPAIPHAVPAVFTPRESMRTLEQSLSNPIHGNRNVYIRGLHPNTDDETLAAYASRFGRIETSKAIIDTSTGACKGFGFAKYNDVRDSELCIRAFYKLGYEVGFARESFNSRLKAEGDEQSTNLYVSNLPKDMTESELGAIFMDYTVSSSRILRDGQGHSRGVGFARFESRDVCEEIIKKFHGQPIGEEGLLLQVRYADTPAQKDLKRVTTERRQFRTTEYNVGAYGTPADVIALSPTMPSPVMPRIAQIARHLPGSRSSGSWKRDISDSASSVSAAGQTAGGINFKDLNTASVKSEKTPVKSAARGNHKQPQVSTPTVSEAGSRDDGATLQSLSPADALDATSPSVKKV